MMKKVIQLTMSSEGEGTYPLLVALCNDGSLYARICHPREGWGDWKPMILPPDCNPSSGAHA